MQAAISGGCGATRISPEQIPGELPIAPDLLDVPHLHLTLTTDDVLGPFFYDKHSLLKVLLTAALQAVREVLGDLYPGVRIGMIEVVHPFGGDLAFKPHVHLVMTKGGLKDDTWIAIDEVPGGRLAAKWRYLLCKQLRQARPHGPALQRANEQGYRDHRGFQVYTESFYPKGLEAAKYIGRYLDHPPLATSHLTAYDGQQVTYWYTDTLTGEKQTVNCSALDFISRLVPHIPPKGMQLVRHAGLYARNVKRKCADLAHTALEALRTQFPLLALEPLTKFLKSPKWRERIKQSFGYEPLACPRCGRTLELTEIWEPRRGHIWIKRWLETHRIRKAARDAVTQVRVALPRRSQQLAFDFFDTS
jgi:Putative transposase